MLTFKRPMWAVVLAALALLWLAASPADAQFFRGGRGGTLPVYGPGVNPNAPGYNPVNPFQRSPNGMSYQQQFTNTLQQARQVRSFPPWYYGYNPYPAPVVTSGPVVNAQGSNPYAANPAVNPYAANPAANPYGSAPPPVNPYGTAAPAADPSNPYSAAGYDPNAYAYAPDPYSGQLRGTADVYRAVGTLNRDVEAARLMRETALQAQLDTTKKKDELDKHVREKTPTYTAAQAKVAADTLRRIQAGATPGEVRSGRALNLLLKDIRDTLGKHPDRGGLGSMPLGEDVLRRLNVTTEAGGNLGLLRDDGAFTWPAAMQQVGTGEQRGAVESLARALSRQAADDSVKANQLQDLRANLEALHQALRDEVNEIPAPEYLAAKRFLNDFDAAAQALGTRGGVARAHAFSRFVRGGKSAHEVADYMLKNGLTFAPATPGDEGAYQAMHTGLANYDIRLNAGVATARQ
jgi:hypothetical protein